MIVRHHSACATFSSSGICHLGKAPQHVPVAGPAVPPVTLAATLTTPAPAQGQLTPAPAIIPITSPEVVQPAIVPAKLADLDEDLIFDATQVIRMGIA